MTSQSLDSLAKYSEEDRHVRSLISEAEANISRIDAQIGDLVCHRERPVTLAPISNVPAEVLVEIFAFILCQDRWLDLQSISSSRWVAIHRISQVCALWRQIVHATPRFWTFLDITTYAIKNFSDKSIFMIQTCLARSAPMPISIRICSRAPAVVLRSLCRSAGRWQSLHIDFGAVNALSFLANLLPGSLQTLEELSLKTVGGRLPAVVVFLSAQRLRKLTLRTARLSQFPMPWSQLTSLHFFNTGSPETCREILRQCTNIGEAIFTTVSWSANTHIADLPTTVLPQLTRLKINLTDAHEMQHPRDPAPFFQPLVMPALKEVTLWTEDDWPSPSSVFTHFQLSSPNIERFQSSFPPMSEGDLVLFLRHAPALKKLHLEHCSFDHNIFDAEGDLEPLAPMLEDLSLGKFDVNSDNRSMACVELMIRSRWWSDEELLAMVAPPRVARWKNVCISQYDWDDKVFSKDFERWMEVSKAQGLQIAVE